jgi:phosphoenolpyruvate-protein kinase (PTS system EI component)
MIELPSAVEVADELAEEADFLSIGGNDLVQYMLAVDRTNEHISDLYVPITRPCCARLKRVVERGAAPPASRCPSAARWRPTAKMLPFLIGIGVRTISVEARQIPQVHDWVAQLDLREEGRRSARVLRLGRIKEVEQALAR